MYLKNNKKLKNSILVGVVLISILSIGYSIMNKEVTLIVRGEERIVSTLKLNVEGVLREQDVEYGENDIISIDLNERLKDGDIIEIIEVREEIIKETEEIPFEVEILQDETLLKGTTVTETEGQSGTNELMYKVIYHNGEMVEKIFIEEVVIGEPINKVVKNGTKVETTVASSRGESTRSDSQSDQTKMVVEATAYTGHGITSTGTVPKWGTIAVDPSIIPYGTKVYIPQFDMTFIAEDTGGAIKGNKIDIYMLDEDTVKNWGRRNIDIYIIG